MGGLLVACGGARPAAPPSPSPTASPAPARLPEPARPPAPAAARPRVDSARLERELVAREAHLPLARALARRSGNPEVAHRAAEAVVREARRRGLSPSLVAGVLLVENAPLDTSAVSRAGAIGLMQVMPVHAGSWACGSEELREVDSSICHGVGVLQMYLKRSGTVSSALKRYNGCPVTARTGCGRYPVRVLQTAASVRREMLRSPGTRPRSPSCTAPPPPSAARSASGSARPSRC